LNRWSELHELIAEGIVFVDIVISFFYSPCRGMLILELITEAQINGFLSEIKFNPHQRESISYQQFKVFLQKVLALQSVQDAAELDLANEELQGYENDTVNQDPDSSSVT
jgi:hypothetical protein